MTTHPSHSGTKSRQNNAFDLYIRTGEGLPVTDWLTYPELKSMPVLANSGQSSAPSDVPPAEWKSIYRTAFDHHLRTGRLVTMGEGLARYERKFNPYHDERGRFTFALAGASGRTPPAASKAKAGDKWNTLGKDKNGKSLGAKDAANARRNSSDPAIRNAQALLDKAVVQNRDGSFQIVKDKISPSLTPQSAWTNEQLIGALEVNVIPGELNSGNDFSSQHTLNSEINTAANDALNYRQKQAIDYFTSSAGGGWSKAQAVGIVANLTKESNLDPGAVQGKGGAGRSLAQWTLGEIRAKWYDSLQSGPAYYLGSSAIATNKSVGRASFYNQLSFINR